jgi:hypothetical protein
MKDGIKNIKFVKLRRWNMQIAYTLQWRRRRRLPLSKIDLYLQYKDIKSSVDGTVIEIVFGISLALRMETVYVASDRNSHSRAICARA